MQWLKYLIKFFSKRKSMDDQILEEILRLRKTKINQAILNVDDNS